MQMAYIAVKLHSVKSEKTENVISLKTLSQLFLIEMKLVVLTVALLLSAVLVTTVTAAPNGEMGKNFSCFYMLL